ncbi:MAG TPA: MerR family transcriptional regulator [Gemmataceae bacterium]|jgi:DNA-binding transcriptional MerR regulator|nr:MerR family transcriptional regulator [Gemmataceae bacterium]
MRANESLWTIDELSARVAAALSMDSPGQANGRVREVPDLRTIRYYTTLGLIDRPAEMQGRTALYGRRHLMQIVAIKRLQGRGQSLADIQQQLVGLTDATLSRLARLPADLETMVPPVPQPAAPAEAPSARGSPSFWKATPEAASALPISAARAGDGLDERDEELLQGLRLGTDVMLLVAATRPVDEEDILAIRTAAAPLLKILEARRLTSPRHERGKS